jgi:hypothetical protein
MAYMLPGALEVGERPQVAQVEQVEQERPRVRWGMVALIALAWLVTLAIAFEAGHWYAEGMPPIGEHLSEMVHHWTGGRFGSMPDEHAVGAWLWGRRLL